MLLPYRIQPNICNKRTKKTSNTNIDNNSHRENDHKIPQLTSLNLKQIQNLLLIVHQTRKTKMV